MDVFSGLASLSFLTLISVERLYAIAWPFLQRTTTTPAYNYSIVITWSLAAVIRFCIRNHQHQNRHHNRSIFLDALLGAYSIFVLGNRIAKRNEDPGTPVDRREQNKKLAMTLFIVTSLSVLAWLPLTVSYIISYLVRIDQLRKLLHYTGRCLQLANSFVNPIVYYARMPEFRRTFKNLFRSVQISSEELQAHQHRVMQPEADIKFITSEVPRDSQN